MADPTPDEAPWEPPLAGTEADHLLGALDRLRWTFRWKADGLDAGALAFKFPTSALSIGGLLLHLGAVEAYRFTSELDNSDPGAPWADLWETAWPDGVFAAAATLTSDELYALYDAAVEASRGRLAAVLAEGGLDQPSALATTEGVHASVRRIVFDLVEEYGRHTGHADLLREAIDGRVGEDPPPGWRPQSGQ